MVQNMEMDYKNVDFKQLQNQLAESRRRYFALRIRKNANELENLSIIKNSRRNIARILTEINKRQRG